jgi:hypothetical protein
MTKKYLQIVDNIVANTIIADEDFITSGAVGDPASWMQSDIGGVGDEYIAPYFKGICPFASWTWSDGVWSPPTPMPQDGNTWGWDEPSKAWFLIVK